MPVYGKLADLFGRKPVILFGIGLFLLGSILCGVAWSMPALIAFRAVQGLGAGAVQPMSDHDRRRHLHRSRSGPRCRATSPASGAISAVVGPTLGGVFSEYVSWRWIFFVNIPLCLLAGVRCSSATSTRRSSRGRHTHRLRGRRRCSPPGCALLILGAARGRRRPGPGTRCRASAIFAVGVRAAGRVRAGRAAGGRAGAAAVGVPPPAAGRPAAWSRSASARSLLGLTSYVPTYVQGVLGHRPAGGRVRAGDADRSAGRSPRPRPAGSTCASGSATPR